MGLLSLVWKIFLRGFGLYLVLSWFWIICFWNIGWLNGKCDSKSDFRLLLVGDPQMEGDGYDWYSRLNTKFNDLYYKFVLWRAASVCNPSHVIVLGDIFSYQFLAEDEFDSRVLRYESIIASVAPDKRVLVNISGNHDIGYGVEQREYLVSRWEKKMGKVNGAIEVGSKHLLVWVNSMVLDGAVEKSLHQAAWDQLEYWAKYARERQKEVLLISHIPLHKPKGSCVGDEPELRRSGSAVEYQTLLSLDTTGRLLSLFSPEAIFSGHDHEGCVYSHSPFTVEYTLRAIQASYSGYTACYETRHKTCGARLMHNTPTLVVIIGSFVWPLLFLLDYFIRRQLRCSIKKE